MTASPLTRSFPIALVFCLALWGCSKPSPKEQVEKGLLPVAPVKGWPSWTLQERMERYHVPGVSIAVFDNFEIVWAAGYGTAAGSEPVSTETLFQAGNLSMLLTTMMALEQVENGKLALDAPIDTALTSWHLPASELTAAQPLTLRHLLSSTAGLSVVQLPGYELDDRLPTLAQMLAGELPANTPPVRPQRPPGQQYVLTPGGFLVVQQALEDVTGTPFAELAGSTVLSPLGMTASSLTQPLSADRLNAAASGHLASGTPVAGKGRVYPELAAGGLWTTPSDLARLLIEVVSATHGKGKVLSAEVAAQMFKTVAGSAGLGALVANQGGTPRLASAGSPQGFFGRIVAYPERGAGAVVLANSDNGRQLVLEIFQGIGRTYEWPGFVPAQVDPVKVDTEALDALTGRYAVSDAGVLLVRRQGDHLEAREVLASSLELWNPIVPIVGNAYADINSGQRVGFKVDRRGKGTGYVFQGPGGQEITLKRLPDDAPPTAHELLETGRVEEAIAAYRQLGQSDEQQLNNTGYALLGAGKVDAAVAVFELNAELHPQSANAYDSLADAYLARGDRAKALEAARKIEENLALDTNTRSDLREIVGGKVKYLLMRLGGETGG